MSVLGVEDHQFVRCEPCRVCSLAGKTSGSRVDTGHGLEGDSVLAMERLALSVDAFVVDDDDRAHPSAVRPSGDYLHSGEHRGR